MAEILSGIRSQNPHLPLDYLLWGLDGRPEPTPGCAPFPCLFDLQLSNGDIYQRFEQPGGAPATHWLYSAYLDTRNGFPGCQCSTFLEHIDVYT